MNTNNKQTTCWCFKVFFRVFGNLTRRLFIDLIDLIYNLCAFCCRKNYLHEENNRIIMTNCGKLKNKTNKCLILFKNSYHIFIF